ncbi:MMPL family transporter [Micromonospora sp. CPCC 205371]|nr:MMPL family transporter [Micromonospora sp. CPCC 205371]
MATLLYRLARFSFRRPWLMVLVWLGLLAVVGVGARGLSGPTSDVFSLPGTESQRAIDLLNERFPEAAADGATARVVFAAPQGQTLTEPANRAAIERAVGELKRAPQVAAVSDPYTTGQVNQAGTVGFAEVTYQVHAQELTTEAREAPERAAATARDAGLVGEVGGGAVKPERGGGSELIGVGVAFVVLLITFGSLVAAGLPLLTAIVGIAIGVGTVTAATGFLDLSSSTTTLALMIGLAVAIDYALFIVSRYRTEISHGHGRQEAAGRALGTAGTAVTFAGLTVIVALTALSVVNLPTLTQMGLAAAFTVLLAVLIALTLLPALLGLAGRWAFALRIPGLRGGRSAEDRPTFEKPTLGRRWAIFITRRPAPVLLAAVLGLGVVALPVLDLRLGMPNDSTAAPGSSPREAYDLLAEGFGAGFNGPLTVVVDTAGGADPQDAARQVADTIGGLDGVATVSPARFNSARDTGLLTVVPTGGPSSQTTEDLVKAIRHHAPELSGRTGADVAVTGQTAVDIDVSARLSDALVPYLLVVVGLAFVLLLLVFRSILIPLTATVGFLLSVAAATFGAVVAVFQWGWLAGLLGVDQTGPVVSLLPVFLIGVVFGLAMDYQIFLVTRMREEFVHGAPPKWAIVTGYTEGARVVTAAALIMISVFAGFQLSDQDLVKQMGFALAVSVVLDAFVVRTAIVPATMALLGARAWWLPRWLDRILPNVDVEGEKLRHLLDKPTEPPSDNRVPSTIEG